MKFKKVMNFIFLKVTNCTILKMCKTEQLHYPPYVPQYLSPLEKYTDKQFACLGKSSLKLIIL